MFYPGSLRRSLESKKPLVQVVEWVSSSQKNCTQRGTAGKDLAMRAMIAAAQQCWRGSSGCLWREVLQGREYRSLESLDARVFLSVGQWQPLVEKEVVMFSSVFRRERTNLQP